jgi:hypothetical protein
VYNTVNDEISILNLLYMLGQPDSKQFVRAAQLSVSIRLLVKMTVSGEIA